MNLNPDEIVSCWAVHWLESGFWRVLRFHSSERANSHAQTLDSSTGRYVSGTCAMRKLVIPPSVTVQEWQARNSNGMPAHALKSSREVR